MIPNGQKSGIKNTSWPWYSWAHANFVKRNGIPSEYFKQWNMAGKMNTDNSNKFNKNSKGGLKSKRKGSGFSKKNMPKGSTAKPISFSSDMERPRLCVTGKKIVLDHLEKISTSALEMPRNSRTKKALASKLNPNAKEFVPNSSTPATVRITPVKDNSNKMDCTPKFCPFHSCKTKSARGNF